MAVQATPFVETALSHTAELFRRELQAGMPWGAGGVVPATPAAPANAAASTAGCSDLAVTAPASGMSVNVAAGQIYVPGTLGSGSGYGMGTFYGYPTVTLNGGSAPTIAGSAAATKQNLTTQGTYYCYNDNSAGAVNLTISAANPTNPRIDVVGAQVEDAAYSGSNNDWKLVVITGTAAASPAVPSFPANFVPLALVWVPAAASSIVAADILDVRVAYGRNPFHANMYRGTTALSEASGGPVVMAYDSVLSDPSGMCTIANSKFTLPVSGIWLFNGGFVVGTPNSGQQYVASLYVNTLTSSPLGTQETNGAAGEASCNGSVVGSFAQGSVIQVIYGSSAATSTPIAVSAFGISPTFFNAVCLWPE